MTQIAKIVIHDEVYCTILGVHPTHRAALYEAFGIEVEGARFMPQVKLGTWDGRVRFYESTGRTYVRLLDEIIPILVGYGYEFDVEDNRHPRTEQIDLITEDHFSHIKGYGGKPMMIRPYQVDAINSLIKVTSGFCIAATGAGKTAICGGLSDMYGRAGLRSIVVVPSGDLVTQTVDAYNMLGLDVGAYSGGIKQMDRQHTIATWQSLQNNPQLMKEHGMFIIDEAHGAKANVIQKLVNVAGADIKYRFGVTGTFPKPLTDQYSLKSTIGPINYEISARWLIDNGYLAEIDIELVETDESYVGEAFPDYSSEKSFIEKKDERLEAIAEDIIKKRDEHGNTLVLVGSKKMGRLIQKLIPDSIVMDGETDNDTRQEEYSEYDKVDGKILICTTGIARQGISIDRIFCLYMVDIGKSFITAIQACGRGLRLADDKNEVRVVDCSSSLKYARRHRNERKKFFAEADYPFNKRPRKLKY